MSPRRISIAGERFPVLLLVLAVVLSGAALVPASSLAAGSISGTVTAASGGGPVADLEVCAWSLDEEGEGFECTETGVDGTYAIEGLAAGDYRVEFWVVSSINLIREFYDGKVDWGNADSVEVEDGFDTPAIDAVLEEGGWIEGRVVDALSKAGLEEVVVCAFPIDESGSSRCVATLPDGSYSILGLATDDYEVAFFPEEVPGGYLEQFYDGKESWFEATPVGVTATAGVDGIDAELRKGGTISGTITDALSGAGIAFNFACALEPFEGEIVECGETGPNGHYSIGGLSAGTYKVWFSPDIPEWELADDYVQQFYDAKPTFAQASSVSIGPGALVSGVDARLVSRKAPPPRPPAALPPAVVPPVSIAPQPRPKPKVKCRKGKRKVTRKGKVRCVRKAKPRRRAGQR